MATAKTTVEVIALRRFGLSDTEMAEIGKKYTVSKEVAKKLQDAGAVKVAL